jgi:hypothetical protein
MQYCRVHIVAVGRIFDDPEEPLVIFAITQVALDRAAREPACARVSLVQTTRKASSPGKMFPLMASLRAKTWD